MSAQYKHNYKKQTFVHLVSFDLPFVKQNKYKLDHIQLFIGFLMSMKKYRIHYCA